MIWTALTEKRPSTAFLSSLVVATYLHVGSLLGISGALYQGIFRQPAGSSFFSNRLGIKSEGWL
jgi:ABC-type Fe3+-siderophore transport system permease subunit